ncbi:hypothetical protein V1264_012060 [Littorina saxatilis]|uniref:H15 domain-containing protein n=1 Tax=Littorina saxatilis TaxID=31220 RepID=A0AAN9C0N5_9CAEN
MPVIKKRITAEYLEREQQRNEQNGGSAADVEGDSENSPPPAAPPPVTAAGAASPLKRKVPSGQAMLKGLDGEVLVEKRKRTLPPGELKLDAWLDSNLEKRADSVLSLVKLYEFYTDTCQQDASNVVEIDVFKTMLHNKFGKEFGLKEGSAYSGLVKTAKPRKKAVLAQSLGYKMKDIIEETLKASGNPSKGMVFSWLKKFIAAKYPALQIEFRPHFLRRALEREINASRVELVKGIGFCGFYRQPGPPAVEEEPKQKKKGAKKGQQGEESADSAEDVAVDADKDDEEKAKAKKDEKGDETAEKTGKDKKKKSQEKEESTEGTEEGKEGEEEKKTEEKKAKKKRKNAPKRKKSTIRSHSNPQTLSDVFPLAMTYMAEPKEATFGRIRKYLEKFYSRVDIDSKLKRCIEHGCETGMWERMSGSGTTGSFQLLVDSFNPEHTESMTDMVCSAIIACNEPKTSSVRMLKSYISEYHPDFNIDTRPHKLKFALEKAEKQNQLRRVTGIGMTGSFQLVKQFTPSPDVLAGEEDEEEMYEFEEPKGKQEVYVVRKTKSGRKAPVERTQIDYSPSFKKKAGAGSAGRGKKKPKQKKARMTSQYAEVSSEEESSSEEEAASDVEGYHPRPSQSRGGVRAAPAKASQKRAAPKAKGKAAVTKGRGKPAAKSKSAPKRGKPARKSPQKKQVKEEDKKAYSPRPTKSGRNANGSTPIKSPAKKRGRTPQAAAPVSDEDEEQYFEVEEEAPPPKKGRAGKAAASKSPAAAATPKSLKKRGAVESSSPSAGRTPRGSRQSYKEADSGDEDDGDNVAPPKSSRSSRKR